MSQSMTDAAAHEARLIHEAEAVGWPRATDRNRRRIEGYAAVYALGVADAQTPRPVTWEEMLELPVGSVALHGGQPFLKSSAGVWCGIDHGLLSRRAVEMASVHDIPSTLLLYVPGRTA